MFPVPLPGTIPPPNNQQPEKDQHIDDVDYIASTENIIHEQEALDQRQSWQEDEKYHEETLHASSSRLAGGLASFIGADDVSVACLHYVPHENVVGCFRVCKQDTEVRCKQCEGTNII